MTEYVQVWKAKRLCPALLRTELVRAEDGTWLDQGRFPELLDAG